MSNARVIRRPVTSSKASKDSSSGGKGKWIAAVLLLLLMGGIAYAFLPSTDPALVRIEELREQMDGATDEQRRELWGQMRQEFENLTPEAREKMRDEGRARWEAREQEQLNKFFALSPQEQIKELDEDIKRDAQRDKERAQRARSRGDGGRGGRGGGGGPGSGDGGRRWGGGSRDSSDPNARRRDYLDNSTPQSRAMRSEYRAMRDERRKKLGL